MNQDVERHAGVFSGLDKIELINREAVFEIVFNFLISAGKIVRGILVPLLDFSGGNSSGDAGFGLPRFRTNGGIAGPDGRVGLFNFGSEVSGKYGFVVRFAGLE